MQFRRPEFPFVITSQNFFLISRLWQGEKKIFLHGRLYVDLSSKICLCFPLEGSVFMSREPGPFLKQAKVASLPSVIGPAGPNIVLRQLVEQIVLSAHSSKQVQKLVASESGKMTIALILKVKCSFSVGF